MTRQSASRKGCTPFLKVIKMRNIPGIKVDTGAKELAGHPHEKITEGLDGLRERLVEYSQMGARFAKWRAVITVGDGIPAGAALRPMRRHWLVCGSLSGSRTGPRRRAGSAYDGDHTLERCCDVTEEVLRAVFNQLIHNG